MTTCIVIGTAVLLMWVVCAQVLGRRTTDPAPPPSPDEGWPTAVWVLLAVASAPVFLGALAHCAFIHPFADDYVNATRARDLGFWGAQASLYQTWTGRFSAAALVSLPPVLGLDLRTFARIVCALDLLALLSGALALAAALGRGVRPACAALFFVVIVLEGLSSPAESLYWATSTITYMAPVGLTLWIFAALAGSTRWSRATRLGAQLFASVSAFVVAGLVEVVWVPVSGALVMTSLVVWRSGGRWRPYAAAAAVLTVAAILSAVAPGNSARHAFEGGGSVEFTLRVGLFGALEQMAEWGRRPIVIAALIALAPTCAFLGRTLSLRRSDVLAVALWLFASLMATWAAAGWGAGGIAPPLRAIGTAWVTFVVGVFGLAATSAAAFPRWRRALEAVPRRASYAAAALLVVNIWGGQGGEYVTDLRVAPDYSAFLEARVEAVQRVGPGGRAAVDLVPASLQIIVHAPTLDLSLNSRDVMNANTARWFGVAEVAVTDPLGR